MSERGAPPISSGPKAPTTVSPIVAQSWADAAIKSLALGFSHVVRPRGHSMSPRIKDGEEVYLAPCDVTTIKKGDVVLVRVRGRNLLHLVKARDGDRLLIGNNHGGTNGWVNQSAVYGVASESSRGPSAPNKSGDSPSSGGTDSND